MIRFRILISILVSAVTTAGVVRGAESAFDFEALKARAKALGIAESMTFAGFQSQGAVAALLEEADMLVLPSFAEGVPVVLMEALASRIPVIASRVAGVQELVEDGVSGFAVPPGDVATLAERPLPDA